MIRLSKLSDYAVVVLSQLARDMGRIVSASGLAESTGIPEPTVSKVLKILVKGNIAVSIRGAAGGYMMARSPDEITVRELIEALEGPIAVTSCLEESNDLCGISSLCPMRGRWQKVNNAIMNTLDDMPLSDLLPEPLLKREESRRTGDAGAMTNA
jgi:FeS assembly SUF system regulator